MAEEHYRQEIFSMKKVISLILLIFLINFVSAGTFLNIYLDKNGEALFLGETDSSDLILPTGVSIKDGKIKGTTQELTSKQGDLWEFSYSLKGAEIIVFLPEDAKLTAISNGEISVENNRILVYFKESNLLSYTIEGSKSWYSWILLLVVIVIIGLVNVTYSLYKKRFKNLNLDLVEQILNSRENKILEQLRKHGNIKSSLLRKLCDMPKASFSRHIQELEKKGLIRRKGEGKNKIIELMPYLREKRAQ